MNYKSQFYCSALIINPFELPLKAINLINTPNLCNNARWSFVPLRQFNPLAQLYDAQEVGELIN